MDATRTFEIRDAGSQSYCNCTILKLELLHNGLPLDLGQIHSLTDRSLTLSHNTKLVRAECDGMITFTTPGVDGTLSLSLCEIQYLREDTPKPQKPKPPKRTVGKQRTFAMIAGSAFGVCMVALAIFRHLHR